MAEQRDAADVAARQHPQAGCDEGVDRERAFDPVRSARAREIEAHGGETRQRGQERRPGVRGAAQPMDAQRLIAAAGGRLDVHGDAGDEVELSHAARAPVVLPIRYATEAGITLRADRMSGGLWKGPCFITARMRSLSCRRAMLASGSPSTSSRSAR